MSFQVSIAQTDQSFSCRSDEAVLAAMQQCGKLGVAVGCRSGGCGVCRVQVTAGRYDTGLMSRAQVSDADRARGIVLACQLYPRSDLELRALGRSMIAADASAAELLLSISRGAARTLERGP